MKYLDKVKGFLDDTEAKKLSSLIGKTSFLGPALEIGTYCGKSAMIFSEACNKNNSYIFTLDHHVGSEEHQVGEEYHDEQLFDIRLNKFNSLPEFLKNIEKFPYSENIIPIIGDSVEVSKNWKIPLGLLFIDGGHSMKAAKNDFDYWGKHLVSGGILAIHDVFPNPKDGGRPPYEIFCIAKKSNKFKEIELIKSLAILEKI